MLVILLEASLDTILFLFTSFDIELGSNPNRLPISTAVALKRVSDY